MTPDRPLIRLYALLLASLAILPACAEQDPPRRLPTDTNILFGYPAATEDGLINMVVEIPAGTQQKWEALKDGSGLKWDTKKGAYRVINYLPYPGNYGMVPRTLLPESRGGDGDPLDVILLGAAVPRGSVIAVRPVGVLKLLDDGEQDDKILAVPATGSLSDVTTLEQLNERYQGVTEIVELWFTNYKGPGEMESLGYGDHSEALRMVRTAASEFEKQLN